MGSEEPAEQFTNATWRSANPIRSSGASVWSPHYAWRHARSIHQRAGKSEVVTIMMAGSHVVVGMAAWAWAAPHLGLPPLDPFALALAVAGSLLPDIDHPQSWVGRRAWMISRPLAAMIGHRGLTHSVLAVIACGLLLRWHGISRAVTAPVVVGYLSHLGADLLTSGGLRLGWPLHRRYAIPLCQTGSQREPVIVAALLIWVGAAILRLHMGF